MGKFTDRSNSLKTLWLDNDITTDPTNAAYDALSPGYSRMELRRTFGSLKRAYSYGRIKARNANPVPVVAIGLVDQNVNEGAALSYQFNSGSFTDAQAIVYSATLSDGSALPGWLTFTPGTRTFSGTAPTVASNTVLTVRVTATDSFGASVTDDFTITIVNL